MLAGISRHVARVGERDVHYRRAGKGPALIVLHQSPRSNEECLPLIERFCDRYTVIAPDTPGNGMSDPLPIAQPSMKDFADALASFMTVIGVGKAMVYGFHTGAMCAFELCRRHPERVAVGVVNGYVHPGIAEQTEILENYFTPLVPDWSGAHLTWCWARMREQFLFYPWFRKDAASRMHYGAPSAAVVHAWVMDLLRAGDAYRGAYRAAFTVDLETAASDIRTPTVVMTAVADWPLYPHLDHMPTPGPLVEVHRPADYAQSLEILTETLTLHAEGSSVPPPAPPSPADRLSGCFVRAEGLNLYGRTNLSGSGRPLVFVHSSGGSAFEAEAGLRATSGTRPVIAIDLPGCGESDPDPLSGGDVAAQARYLAAALSTIGVDGADIVARESGAAVATALGVAVPSLVKSITARDGYIAMAQSNAIDPIAYAPEIRLSADGSHLLQAFAMVREQRLFRPWVPTPDQIILNPGPAQLSPQSLNQATLDLLKAREIFHTNARAHLAYDFSAAIPKLACDLITQPETEV